MDEQLVEGGHLRHAPDCTDVYGSSMELTTIEVQADGPRGRLSLNRPEKLNPLSTTTLLEIAEAARWFDAQRAVKVVVVEGRGRAFSAGADLGAFSPAGSTGGEAGPASQLSQRDAADA